MVLVRASFRLDNCWGVKRSSWNVPDHDFVVEKRCIITLSLANYTIHVSTSISPVAPSKDHSIKYFALSHSTKRAQSNIISIKCVTFQSVYQRVTFDPVAWNYGFMKKIPESVAIMFSGSVHLFTSATLGLIFVCQHQILHQPWKNTDSCNIFATFQHPGDDDCGSNFLVVKEEEGSVWCVV